MKTPLESIRFENSTDKITVDATTSHEGEPLITFITNTQQGTKYERWTVAQISGEQVRQLKEFLEGLEV
jgi:hypothetical protein